MTADEAIHRILNLSAGIPCDDQDAFHHLPDYIEVLEGSDHLLAEPVRQIGQSILDGRPCPPLVSKTFTRSEVESHAPFLLHRTGDEQQAIAFLEAQGMPVTMEYSVGFGGSDLVTVSAR